jgi:hypothetical protein
MIESKVVEINTPNPIFINNYARDGWYVHAITETGVYNKMLVILHRQAEEPVRIKSEIPAHLLARHEARKDAYDA